MSSVELHIKNKHAQEVLASLSKLRAWNWICDFTIAVEGETFPVHRTVLASCSEYFLELFKRDGIEAKEGGIEVKGLGASAVKECIEFMYTGIADIILENVDSVLIAASHFKLQGLTELCQDFLTSNLSAENCLRIREICNKNNLVEKKRDVESFIAKNFHELVQTAGFLTLERDDLQAYLSSPNADPESIWNAITSWVKFRPNERKKHYFQLLSLNLTKLPIDFLLCDVWPEQMTKESKFCRDLLAGTILSDVEKLTQAITVNNCFILRGICQTYHHANSQEALYQIQLFMIKSFENIADSVEIVNLTKDEIFKIFLSSKTKYSSEITKWEVAVKWTKHNSPFRKKYFPDLFSAIKLENLMINFIKDVIHLEPLVQESPKCNGILMNALFTHARKENGESPAKPNYGKRKFKESKATKPKTYNLPHSCKESSESSATSDHQKDILKRKSLKTGDLSVGPTPDKVRKVGKSRTVANEHGTCQSRDLVTDKTYLAVFDPPFGKVRGLSLTEVKWKDLAMTKVTKYAFHGITSVGNKLFLQQGNILLALEQNKWVKLASKSSPTSREAKMLTFQNSIYVIQDGSVSVYDVDLKKWEEHLPFVSMGEGFCACATDMYIYVLGGCTDPKKARRYDPLSGAVSEIKSLLTARKDAACASLKNKVFVMGGTGDNGANATVESYDEQSDLWSVVPSMECPRSNFCAYAFDEKIYAIGGEKTQDKFDSVEVYEVKRDEYSWRVLHNMLKVDAEHSACIVEMSLD